MQRSFFLILLSCLACTASENGDTLASFTFGTSPNPEAGETAESSEGSEDSETEASESESGDGAKLDFSNNDLPGGLPEIAEVFGHSGKVLYRLDPETLEIEEVGPFFPCGTPSIIDIALDADSNMYGTAFGALWRLERETGECTLITEEGNFSTSLSFVPAGTIEPDHEVLVGYRDEEYIRIDTQSGAISTQGTLSGGFESSGDIVSVIGGSTYLTVYGPGCDATDCIIEVDPVSGDMVKNYGSVGYDQVFGLAFWGGRAYGFAREGVVFEIEFLADSVITTPIPIPMAPPGLEWFGAGSTTSAPPTEG